MAPMMRRAIALASVALPLACAGLGAEPNLPPRAELIVVDVIAGVPASFTLAASDPNGDPLVFTVLGGPHHGRLEGEGPHLTYAPDRGFVGEDELRFAATDPFGAFDLGTVRLRVTAQVTVHRFGEPNLIPELGLSSLATHLNQQQVRVWYVFYDRAVPFAIGQPIPVLLPPGGEPQWVGLCHANPDGVRFVPISAEWSPSGWLRVATHVVPPGVYILTAVKENRAFSFLVSLGNAPAPGVHLAGGTLDAPPGT